jgi:CheY-like chemotaxis protein
MKSTPVIWVVDDDEDDQYLIQHAFKAARPTSSIKAIYDGQQLLSCLKHALELPQLVLLDLNMPGKDGFEILEELRKKPAYKQLPVVMLTTSSEESDKTRSAALGASGFLTKPATLAATVKLFQELCGDCGIS